MKFNKYILAGLIGVMSLASCTDDVMDNINKDEAHPGATTVNAKFQITDAITSTAYTTYAGAYGWYVSSYTEQEVGTGMNQMMRNELRNPIETANAATFDNEWNGTYANINNLKAIIAKCGEGNINEGQSDIKGMAEVLLALNIGALTDLHGDVPFSETGVEGVTAPKVDSQEEIYNSIFALLDDAIVNLEKANDEGMDNAGQNDILFGGDCSQWIGLAHAAKARYLLHTMYRNPNVLTDVVAEAEAAVSDGFAGAELSIFNGVDCDNSWAAFWRSRAYTGSSKTVVDLMNEREDARVAVYNADRFGTDRVGVPGNKEDANCVEELNIPGWLKNGAATIHIFSKSEIYFIMAEAKTRLGMDASVCMATAVEASFDDYAKSDGMDVDFAASSVSNYLGTLPVTLKEIMVQKYLAQARDEQIETYNDIRRCKALGEEFITLTNANNTNSLGNNWPLRLPYGKSDVTANPNVAKLFGTGNDAGKYIFTENVWIYGGNR